MTEDLLEYRYIEVQARLFLCGGPVQAERGWPAMNPDTCFFVRLAGPNLTVADLEMI